LRAFIALLGKDKKGGKNTEKGRKKENHAPRLTFGVDEVGFLNRKGRFKQKRGAEIKINTGRDPQNGGRLGKNVREIKHK